MDGPVIDFNTISIQELEQLPGIGKAKAAIIVEHRKLYSKYNSINDLIAVEGITKTLITKLQDEYTIEFGDNENTDTVRRKSVYLKRQFRRSTSQTCSCSDAESPTPEKKLKNSDIVSPCSSIGSSISHVLPSCASPGYAVRKRLHSEASSPPASLQPWLDQFQDWGREERLIALNDLIGLCDMSVVRHMMAKIEPHFQRDFISLLPKELALYVLSFLEPKDLCFAAKTCRYWRILAEDNL